MENLEQIEQEENVLPPSSSKRNYLLIGIITVLAIVIGGGILWYVFQKEESSPQIEPSNTRESISAVSVDENPAGKTILATIPHDYEDIEIISFSSDGKQVAYVMNKERKDFVVVNDEVSRPYDWVIQLKLSPDGNHLAYVAQDDTCSDTILVLDGKEICDEKFPWNDLYDFSFSPDSKRIVLFGDLQSYDTVMSYQYKNLAVIDTEGNTLYSKHFLDTIFISEEPFSSDSQKIVYQEEIDDQYAIVVVDIDRNEETVLYDDRSYYSTFLAPVFSPDSQKVAYMPWYGPGKASECGVVVIDQENEIRRDDTIDCYNAYPLSLGFTPQSQKVTYIHGTARLSIGGEQIELFNEYEDDRFVNRIVFSDDEQIYAYVLGRNENRYDDYLTGEFFVRVNSQEFGPYDWVDDESLIISFDKRYIEFGAKQGNELLWIVKEVEKQ